MFESAFALDAPARRSPLLISFMIQATTVAVVLLIPLYYVEQLTVLPTMPVPTYAPKLPHVKIVNVIREAAAAMSQKLTAPQVIREITMPKASTAVNQSREISYVGIPDGAIVVPGFTSNMPVIAQPKFAPPPPPTQPKVDSKPVAKTGPSRIGGEVMQAKLINQVKPRYPVLAVQSRTQGTVRLQAVIAKDGTIQNLTLTSGHPLLVPAAMEAVRQWRYRPTTLNGEVVEVLTQIDVNFTLSQ